MTEEMLLDEVRRVAETVGKPVLSVTDFRAHSKINISTISRSLGGWDETLRRAGLCHMCFRVDSEAAHAYRVKYSDEELTGEIRRVARLVGKPFLIKDDFARYSKIGPTTLIRRFGGWKNALDSAGVGDMFPGNSGQRMQGESRGSLGRGAAGRGPRKRPDAYDVRLYEAVRSSIWGYSPARRVAQGAGTAGVDSSWEDWGRRGSCRPRGHSREELVGEIRRVAAQVHNSTLSPRLCKTSQINLPAVHQEFGTWRQAVEAAGLGQDFSPAAPPVGPSDEELVTEVRRVAAPDWRSRNPDRRVCQALRSQGSHPKAALRRMEGGAGSRRGGRHVRWIGSVARQTFPPFR